MDKALISVVIPVYNEKHEVLKNTLESVIKQTYENIEILVIDDGSDISPCSAIEEINDHRILYEKLEHKNANVARNHGIIKSRGKYIAMLDSDDLWLETHIEDCAHLMENTCADGLYGSLMLKNQAKNSTQIVYVRELKTNETMINYLLSTGYGAQTSTLFLSSESAKDILWNPNLKRHQDYDFVVRYSKKYKFAVKATPSVIYLSGNKISAIDFKSCIQFIEENKEDINPNLYTNYNRQMLNLAKFRNESHEIIEHYQIEIARYDRIYWLDLLYRISEPVLSNMSKGELKKNMPVEYSPVWDGRNKNVAYMEAFGRLMAGIAPWLALPGDDTPEGIKRRQIHEWALLSYANAVDPGNSDFLLWSGASQVLVDAAYIANSFIRAPRALWEPLDPVTKERYIKQFKSLRKIRPFYSNWLLFRAMIEAFLASIDEEYDVYALDITIRKINEWYLGDGWYGDGTEFSCDYYNGFVIQPMLVEVIEAMDNKRIASPVKFDLALRRMQRYNQLMERLISPEAAFPAVGRSITYRMGAFQTLALSAWKYGLPDTMTNGQVRNALTSVMKRMFSVEGNFNKEGYLQLGFVGSQPEIADYYTNTGSLYLTSLVFLPLGLPANHPFWISPAEEWTSLKAWSSKPFPKDYHESIKNFRHFGQQT